MPKQPKTIECPHCGKPVELPAPKQRKQAVATDSDVETGFENFWASYPRLRREKKAKALVAYRRALAAIGGSKHDAINTIQAAVAEFAMSPRGKGRFCPGPEPWLNGGCWDDDPLAWKYESLDDVPARPKTQKPLLKLTDGDMYR